MQKNRLKFWIDRIILIDILVVILSGVLVYFVLNKGIWLYTNFIFSFTLWNNIYKYSAVLLLTLAIIRIIMNFLEKRKANKRSNVS